MLASIIKDTIKDDMREAFVGKFLKSINDRMSEFARGEVPHGMVMTKIEKKKREASK